MRGHIDSISRGITDRDNSSGPELLTNVSPTFEWVRVAQRIARASVSGQGPTNSKPKPDVGCWQIVLQKPVEARAANVAVALQHRLPSLLALAMPTVDPKTGASINDF